MLEYLVASDLLTNVGHTFDRLVNDSDVMLPAGIAVATIVFLTLYRRR